ncbi:MAG TPA: hypothetical protein ENK41_05100, partial [Rhodobacteraceae bacterium]|nr:hypothetical protein [Paracoccaceae bacterium]
MRILTVTTTADVVDKNDGVLSLREAVNKAARLDKPVEVRFDTDTFTTGGFNRPEQIQLQKQLAFKKGVDITIDGSLDLPGLTYSATINPAANGDTAIKIATGAKVTFRDLVVSGGSTADLVTGANGHVSENGTPGAAGTNAQTTDFNGPGTGNDGGDAGDGTAAPVSGGDGAQAVGGIINRGDLTLDHVRLQSLGARGGDGNFGGDGGRGGKGGNGDQGVVGGVRPGQGGDGGKGGDASRGGDGGNAVGAIMNFGKLTVHDVDFSNNIAEGGRGGQGGAGGKGGHGGNWGSFGSPFGDESRLGGIGGDGGKGGRGGNGGDAASEIMNVGEVIFQGIQGTPSGTARGGEGKGGGTGGDGGGGGISWDKVLVPSRPQDGPDGTAGLDGVDGTDGLSEGFIGTTPKLGTVFVLSASETRMTEVGTVSERRLLLGVEKFGDNAGKVHWRIKPGEGVDADDFQGGTLPGGTLKFSANTNLQFISITTAVDAKLEGKESFTVELFKAKGGKISSSREVEIKIRDDRDLVPIEGTNKD